MELGALLALLGFMAGALNEKERSRVRTADPAVDASSILEDKIWTFAVQAAWKEWHASEYEGLLEANARLTHRDGGYKPNAAMRRLVRADFLKEQGEPPDGYGEGAHLWYMLWIAELTCRASFDPVTEPMLDVMKQRWLEEGRLPPQWTWIVRRFGSDHGPEVVMEGPFSMTGCIGAEWRTAPSWISFDPRMISEWTTVLRWEEQHRLNSLRGLMEPDRIQLALDVVRTIETSPEYETKRSGNSWHLNTVIRVLKMYIRFPRLVEIE